MSAALQLKGSKVVAAALAAPATYLGVDLTTGQAALAALLAFLSAVLAAWLATRPAIIKVRHEKELAEEARNERWLQSRILYHSKVATLVRQSKHNALGYVDACHAHIYKLRALLPPGVEVPEFTFKYHDELCAEEDKGMAQLVFPSEVQPAGTQSGAFGGMRDV